MQKSLRVFVSYAREDDALLNNLDAHLASLRVEGLITSWDDRKISPGTEWEREIDSRLDTAQIILLLISAQFLNSQYCSGIEMKRALARHHAGKAYVIPVILRSVVWEIASLRKLQALPKDAEPVTSKNWHKLDEAFSDVARGVAKVARALLKKDELMSRCSSYYETRQYEEALKILEQIFDLGIDSAQLYKSKGDILWAQRQYEKALEAFEQAIELNDSDAIAYHSKGWLLNDLKRHEEALLACEDALQLDPNYARAYHNKGFALLKLKRYEEALAAFEQAIQLGLENVAVHNDKGLALYHLGRNEEAVATYQRAIELGSTDAGGWAVLGLAFCRLERYEEALVTCEEALQLDRNATDAYLGKGRALSGLARHEEALIAFEEVIQRAPHYVSAYRSKGDALYTLKRHEEALTTYEQALNYEPNSSLLYYSKGNTLYHLQRNEEAVDAYNQAIQHGHRTAPVYHYKGQALCALNRYEEALTAYKEALLLKSADPAFLIAEEYYPEPVSRAIWECYYQSSKVMSKLGVPIVISKDDAQKIYSKGTSGYKRPFKYGSIYWSERSGAQPVWGGYNKLHRRHNGPQGLMGFPLASSLKAARSPQGTTGSFQRFEGEQEYPEDIPAVPVRYGASAYYSEKYGTHLTSGSIGVCYERLGGTSGRLGFPTSSAEHVGPSQHPAKTKGLCKHFEGGRIYWSSRTGAYPVCDSIADLHRSLGGASGRLGFPLSGKMSAETSPQGTTGMLQRFEGGQQDALPVGDEWDYSTGIFVYSSKYGVYPVWGGPRIYYERVGSTRSVLGFPISLETVADESPQGTTGWYQRFEGGIIFWCGNYGSIPVVGSILALYDEFGGTEGRFGFPKSPEKPAEQHSHMLLQEFEGGVICVLHEDREEHRDTVLV